MSIDDMRITRSRGSQFSYCIGMSLAAGAAGRWRFGDGDSSTSILLTELVSGLDAIALARSEVPLLILVAATPSTAGWACEIDICALECDSGALKVSALP
jgi:hypothetical protein